MDEYYKSPTVEKIVLVVVGVRWPWLERHGPIQRNFGAVDGELGVVVGHLGHYISRQGRSCRLVVVKVLELAVKPSVNSVHVYSDMLARIPLAA